MHVNKIDSEVRLAPKIDGHGNIHYCLWTDEFGDQYVEIIKNEDSGTISDFLFSVSEYESKRNSDNALRNVRGYDRVSKSFKVSENNNDGAFLKAVLRHLLPNDE